LREWPTRQIVDAMLYRLRSGLRRMDKEDV
jgi:hypothetical protein